MTRVGRLLSRGLIATFYSVSALAAYAAQSNSIEEVALLTRPDRQKILEEGAKKKGKLLWYTTLIVNQALKPLKEAFETKYPYVQLDFHRADLRAVGAAHAGGVSGKKI
jgi:hypothetical protein